MTEPDKKWPLITHEDELPWVKTPRPPGAPDLLAMAKKKSGSFIVEKASETKVEQLRWLWKNRILLGYINVVLGEEGIGKGNFVAWLISQVTRGKLPGDLKGKPRRVIVTGDEDSWSRVWVPRLTLAGADLKMVLFIHEVVDEDTDGRRPFNIAKDAGKLAAMVKKYKVGLVYFDQFLDTLGVGTDENKAKPIRDALQPLRTAAHDVDCAFLGTLHPNKRRPGSSFRDRMSGTPAWNQLARSGMLLTKHPHDSSRRALVVPKHNYSEGAACFEFTIKPGTFTTDDGDLIEQSFADDCNESALTEDDVLNEGEAPPTTKADLGRTYLAERLNGSEVLSVEIKRELKEKFGIGPREARRLLRDIGGQIRQEGYGPENRSYWHRS